MADESPYSTATDTTPLSSNKRKFDDQPTPPPSTRRQTGFSSPISDPAPPPSYNSVPPPVDEIQMAKQKAQEIAARIMSGAGADIKRPRVENGASGFDSVESNKGYSSAPPGSVTFSLCIYYIYIFVDLCPFIFIKLLNFEFYFVWVFKCY